MLVRIAYREDPDQTTSVCAVCVCLLGRLLVFEILEHLLYTETLSAIVLML